jgi:hypothetical protein
MTLPSRRFHTRKRSVAANTRRRQRRGLSAGLTRLGKRLIAEDPEFVPLKPGEIRPPEYYIGKNAAKMLRRARKNSKPQNRATHLAFWRTLTGSIWKLVGGK